MQMGAKAMRETWQDLYEEDDDEEDASGIMAVYVPILTFSLYAMSRSPRITAED